MTDLSSRNAVFCWMLGLNFKNKHELYTVLKHHTNSYYSYDAGMGSYFKSGARQGYFKVTAGLTRKILY